MNKLIAQFFFLTSFTAAFAQKLSALPNFVTKPEDIKSLHKKCWKLQGSKTGTLHIAYTLYCTHRNPIYQQGLQDFEQKTSEERAQLIKNFEEMPEVLQYALCDSVDRPELPSFDRYLD